MADLVALDDLKIFMTVTGSADDALLQTLLDGLEDLFESECGRSDTPFQAAESARVELHDGTGTVTLYLEYPIDTIATITIGADPDDPDKTLDPDDVAVVSWRAGRRRLVRVDGDTWGDAGVPNCVRITYDTLDELPATAGLAIMRVCAAVYRQLGAEDVKSDRTASYSRDLAQAAADDPIWQLAVRGNRVVRA